MTTGWLEKYKILKFWKIGKKILEKIPSLNASSLLKYLFKPDGGAQATDGSPEASNRKNK